MTVAEGADTPRVVRAGIVANGHQPPPGLPKAMLPAGFGRRGPTTIFVGCHGGAGVSTVSKIAQGYDGGRYWPIPPAEQVNVVLVTRTHADGLRCAQDAARQWADGLIPPTVRLLGLAAVADMPGKLPKALRHLLDLISGGVPAVWHLPWLEELRMGEPFEQIRFPAPFTEMSADLQRLVHGAPLA